MLVLAGCGTGSGPFGVPPAEVTVAGGAVVVAGPAGFCIDRRSLHRDARGEFVLLGSCAAISGNPAAPAPARPAILTATVSEPAAASLERAQDRLPEFFRSERGRAALARNGQASSVRILGTDRQEDALLIHLSDSSAGRKAGLHREYWRALFPLRERIVTLSVIGYETGPMEDAEARLLLLDFVRQLRKANPEPARNTAEKT